MEGMPAPDRVPDAVVLARHRARLARARRAAARRPRGGRGDRRRRVHRPVDRLLPGPGRPGPAGRGLRARDRRVRRVGPQRRLVLGPVPRLAGQAGADGGPGRRRSPCTGPCRQTVDEVGRVAAAEGIDCHWAKGGTVQLARSAVQLRAGQGRGRRGPVVRLRRGRPAAADRRRGPGAWPARPACSAAPTRRTAPRSIPRGWSGGWPMRSASRGVSLFERTPVLEISPGQAGHGAGGRCGPGT